MNNLMETPQVIGWKLWDLDFNWEIFSQRGEEHENEPARCDVVSNYLKIVNLRLHEKVPEINCTCGYYYTSSKEKLLNYWRNDFGGRVVFELALYGKIVECEYGGRAEYFKVLRVILTEDKLNGMSLPGKYPYVVLPTIKMKPKSAKEWVEFYQNQQLKVK